MKEALIVLGGALLVAIGFTSLIFSSRKTENPGIMEPGEHLSHKAGPIMRRLFRRTKKRTPAGS